MNVSSRLGPIAVGIALAVTATLASAAAQRTFVASNGNDANPCSLGAPCRSFNAAIAQTFSGGEIIVLDSAGYGAATITQPISITAPAGVYAGISVFSGAGITVNAGSGTVVLRGLSITALGGTIGVDYQSGARLYVDDSTVTGFSGTANSVGMRAALAASGNLSLTNVVFRDNTTGLSGKSTSGTLNVNIESSTFERNDTGIDLGDGTTGVVNNSTVTRSTANGIAGKPTTAGRTSWFEIRNTVVSDNATGVVSGVSASAATFVSVLSSVVTGNATGILVSGNTVYGSNNAINRNTTGLSLVSGGLAQTAGDNALANNTTNGAFTSTVPML